MEIGPDRKRTPDLQNHQEKAAPLVSESLEPGTHVSRPVEEVWLPAPGVQPGGNRVLQIEELKPFIQMGPGEKPDAVETLTLAGIKGHLIVDTDASNPRTEFDNLGVMACFHKRLSLGDEDHGLRHEDFSDWNAMEGSILAADPDSVILPLYLLDHSGITISTKPFGDPWDSGRVGLIFVSSAKIMEEYGDPKDPAVREKVENYLRGEVETYDQYLTEDVYGFQVVDSEGGDLDSCWGYFGREYARESLREELANQAIRACITPDLILSEAEGGIMGWLQSNQLGTEDLRGIVATLGGEAGAEANEGGLESQVQFIVGRVGWDKAQQFLSTAPELGVKLEESRRQQRTERIEAWVQENVTLNPDYKPTGNAVLPVYVIKSGDGYSCHGFEFVADRSRKYAEWLGSVVPDVEKGSLSAYVAYRELAEEVMDRCRKQQIKCPVELTTQLVGLEGKRVEVIESSGEKRRFWVGRSTGTIPIHLEINNSRSTGGHAVTGAPFQSVTVIRDSR